MSSLGSGRRGQDTVAFIQELNMVHDPADEFLNFEADDNLDMFRNTTFVDESGASVDFQAFPPKPDDALVSTTSTVVLPATTSSVDNINPYLAQEHVLPSSLLQFSHSFPMQQQMVQSPVTLSSPSQKPSPPWLSADVPALLLGLQVEAIKSIRFPEGLAQIQPAPIETFSSISSEQQSQQARQEEHPESKSPSLEESPGSPDGRARKEADSDKRKRNTAASARFRVKKKLREQALEKKTKDLEELVSHLEGKVSQLETENKWLKNLVMEKNEGKDEIISLLKILDSKRAGGSSGAKPES